MQIIVVAIVAGFMATMGPVVLAIVTAKQRRRDKIEDWTRQDLVAERLIDENKKTADKLSKENQLTADRLHDENKKTSIAVIETNSKIDGVAEQAHEIHGLVNSAMSAEMRRSLQSTEALIVVLEELMGLKGYSQDASDRIESQKAVASELRATLNDRLKGA
jgi:hypothetical protein